MGWLRDWRRRRVLRRANLDQARWLATLDRYEFLRVLSTPERARLRDRVLLFLDEKAIYGTRGLAVSEDMSLSIAAQACILILNLDIDYFRGWSDVVVYPGEFMVEYEYMDEDGVVHAVREPTTGEAWLGGPLLLSWADAEGAGQASGYNVVIHEFAHKLDMLNGDANGFPPLHADMDRGRWAHAFSRAYEELHDALSRGEDTVVDSYASEHPSEFFAVVSEAFFEAPLAVRARYPEVYEQLACFYCQDPAARAHSAGLADTSAPAGQGR
jgi:Mlc titration factor MtfA (ptsG expression regulator)